MEKDLFLSTQHSVKYLGILLDEHMSWNDQVYQTKLKLNHATGILSKLCSYANINTLRIAYYSFFQSHLQYGIQLWGQKNQEIKQIYNAETPKSCSEKN